MSKYSEHGKKCGLHNVYFDVGTGRLVTKQSGSKGDKNVYQNDPKRRHKRLFSRNFLFSSTWQWCFCLGGNIGKNILHLSVCVCGRGSGAISIIGVEISNGKQYPPRTLLVGNIIRKKHAPSRWRHCYCKTKRRVAGPAKLMRPHRYKPDRSLHCT
jgi:hypothetical protein